ncbi:MAG: phage head morphogenesis protein [Dermatophilaceae bacterium]|nr:phage head morphogenesis protein [Dermatophilaceae bacterium]
MAIGDETLTLIYGMRVAMLKPVDATAQAIIRAWGVAWNEIAGEWDAALAELVSLSKDGKWPNRAQIARAKRAQRAMAITRDALQQLADELPITVTQVLPRMTADAADWARRITASQYPAQAGTAAEVIATFSKVDDAALSAIVKRTTQQVTSLARPLSAQAERAMNASLVRGIALGENPRTAARRMLERVHGEFDGGRNRALVIARTELLDAHRAGGMAQDKANADVLRGWQWVSALDTRTCPSCWARHGETFALDVPGPDDHQQGRCARVPLAKSWRDLGFDVDEPESTVPDARAKFAGLPREQQVAIMGKARLDLLDQGKVAWSDLAQKRSTAGWRDSWAPTPVKDLAA